MRILGGLLAATCIATAFGACGEADRVDGQGYSYAVPDGWDDVSDEAQDQDELQIAGIRPDSFVIGDRDEGFSVNVNVIHEPGLPQGVSAAEYAEVSLAALRDPEAAGFPPDAVETLKRLQPRQLSQPTETKLGGRKAVTWKYASSQNGRELRHEQVAAVMDGAGYTVTLSALPGQLEDGEDALGEVVDSWEWD
jgi:hypothetical protein